MDDVDATLGSLRFLPAALRRRLHRRLRDDERGVVVIVVAVFMVVSLGFAALVIDLGNGRQIRRQAQAAADACAVAAAEELATIGADFTGTSAQWASVVDQCKQYAFNNLSVRATDWVGCTDPGHLAYLPDSANANQCISADLVAWPNPQPGETTWVNRIRVRIPTQAIRTVFGPAIDEDELTTQAVAVAGVTRKRTIVETSEAHTAPGGPCAICVLGDGFAFDGQNGDIAVTGGAVVVNADPASGWAAYLNPNGHVRVQAQSGIGGPGAPSKWSGDGFDPDPVTRSAVPDPLAHVPACGTAGATCPTNTASASPYTLSPGIYGTISGSHFLNPGVYVIKGGIRLSGNDQITGYGVTLYFACADYPDPCSELPPSQREGAGIRATGNGALLLTAPTEAQCQTQPSVCPYVGITIFADRDNTATFTFRGNGTNENGSAAGSSGTIYMRSGTFDLRGNGYTLASQIVTGRLTMQGNPSGVTVAYDLSRNAPESHTYTVITTTEAFSYDATGLES